MIRKRAGQSRSPFSVIAISRSRNTPGARAEARHNNRSTSCIWAASSPLALLPDPPPCFLPSACGFSGIIFPFNLKPLSLDQTLVYSSSCCLIPRADITYEYIMVGKSNSFDLLFCKLKRLSNVSLALGYTGILLFQGCCAIINLQVAGRSAVW